MDNSLEQKEMPFRERYRESLEKTFNKVLVPHFGRNQELSILSVGCNFGFETKPLLDLFPNSFYKGIDIDETTIKAARRFNEDVGIAHMNRFNFEVGDLRNIKSFGNKPWDLIIVRHPQVLKGVLEAVSSPEEWRKIILNSIDSLSDKGIIFFSSDTREEASEILRDLRPSEKNLEIVINEENEFANEKGPFTDRFVIVAKRM